MDHKGFENWFFNTLITAIPPASTTVMDSAPYHSRKKDKAPTLSSTKATMMKWLQENIPFPTDLGKPELYQLVKLHKTLVTTYAIDSKATKLEFTVIWLPPYHCHYNPIKMVWSYLKWFVKEWNKTFKLKDDKELFSKHSTWSHQSYDRNMSSTPRMPWMKTGLVKDLMIGVSRSL